jgi:hypothetical protein
METVVFGRLGPISSSGTIRERHIAYEFTTRVSTILVDVILVLPHLHSVVDVLEKE